MEAECAEEVVVEGSVCVFREEEAWDAQARGGDAKAGGEPPQHRLDVRKGQLNKQKPKWPTSRVYLIGQDFFPLLCRS